MFGLLARAGDEWRYRAEWAHDEGRSARSSATVIDAIHERLRDDPAMHVYHYGHVEVSVLKRLCMLYAIREDELDQLLRRHVFVDLHAGRPPGHAHRPRELRAQAGRDSSRASCARPRSGAAPMRCSSTSTTSARATSSTCGAIESYNDEDCRSTVAVLRLAARPGARRTSRGSPGRRVSAGGGDSEPSERELLREQLVEGEAEGSERWLAGELLAYHSRAAKQQWWAYFARKEMTQEQLLADSEALAGLELAGRSRRRCGRQVARPPDVVPATGAQGLERRQARGSASPARASASTRLDEDAGLVWIKRGIGSTSDLPRAAMPDGPIADDRSTRTRSRASPSRSAIDPARFPRSSACCATTCP